MAEVKTYYQCDMRMVDHPQIHTTGWIEARGAKVGAQVELKPQNRFWEVVAVHDVPMPGDVLAETQQQRRKPPPSIRDTKKDKRQQEQA